ncbi:O-phospho-L-serine:2-oxoglutarate transaminase [Saccharomycopsis crataegensis]|uniref:phosphoserine transaminase n=1 Tax=Saccharomycopsis crataegensis TaxID=43959 RepID=A0AAV5QTK2_9ASCO|nr:O-phospho-L-serine:2-oxoglutarate transaminase [Saccharomycopsis crataegensis]
MSVPTRPKAAYFGAGPALLPTSVLQQASIDLITYLSNPVGVGEISHRSKDAINIIDSTKAHLSEILNIPDTHEVFFLQGGGTTGFSSVATNLLASFAAKTGKKGQPAYAITGTWSKKSYEEAARLGLEPQVATNGINSKFTGIAPVDQWKKLDPETTPYIYYCDNETVNGVEFHAPPVEATCDGKIPLVSDMSSNFLSKKIDVSKFGLIFAGAQKNVGIAGITIYIIRKDLIPQVGTEELNKLNIPITPIAFHYPTVVKNNSAYNTIPIFTVHVLNLVLKNLLANGGLAAQEKENVEKAQLLYGVLDKHPQLFNLPVAKDSRSKMNVVFTINGEGKEEEFVKKAGEQELSGLKGHRSVGGIRASIYNAIDLETVGKLTKFIEEFASA